MHMDDLSDSRSQRFGERRNGNTNRVTSTICFATCAKY